MLKKIKLIFPSVKKSLFSYNNQPFTKFSIFMIILLDIFLLFTILQGINSEKKMSPEVYQKYPAICQNYFNPDYERKIWDNINNIYITKIDKFPFSSYYSFPAMNNYGYYSSKSVQIKDNYIVSDTCRELDKKIAVFRDTKEFKNNKKLLENLKNKKRNILAEINNIEQRYNTVLFEKNINSESKDFYITKNKYYSLLKTEKNIDVQIASIKKVNSYNGYDEFVKFIMENREKFKSEIKEYTFWQPFIAFLYLLKFTLPLILLSIFTYRISNKVGDEPSVPMKLLKLVSSHIILISIVPIFINVLYLIYHIIPHRFLEKVVEFLYSFGLIFLGYYGLIFLGIVFFGLIIFFIQRSYLRRESKRQEIKEKTLYIDAYNNSACPNCKNKVDYLRNYCGYCKEELNRNCSSCGAKTPKHIKYCLECGEE